MSGRGFPRGPRLDSGEGMIRYERRFRVFAMCLSALAGYVDAAGFVISGGLFVSFMSGNSTRLAVAATEGSSLAILAAGLVALFLIGVIAGALLAPWRPERRKTLVLALGTASLSLAAVLFALEAAASAALLLAFAMGSLNNVFLREGEVSIGVTYMTGTLVRMGQRIAGALRGQEPSDWPPYLLLWSSLVAGAGTGASLAAADPTLSLGIAAGLAMIMTAAALWLETTRPS